jgi:formamidopyrimidine-DNA glycosylase
MPEVVEVKKYSDFLKKHVKQNRLLTIKILKGRYKTHQPFTGFYKLSNALPLAVKSVKTKGKFIYFIFENDMVLFNTLGLSGGWVYEEGDNEPKHPIVHEFLNKNDVDEYRQQSLNHLNIMFGFERGSLYFFDTLSYGTLKVTTMDELNKKLDKIGPDMLDKNTTFEVFTEKIDMIRDKSRKIANVLMDQRVVSGIGNYLRADSLWLSGISPHRKVKNLDENDLKKIYTAIRSLVWSEYNYKKAIKLGFIGKTFRRPQMHGRDFFVYYEKKDINDNPVKKEELYEGSQKRFIYWAPAVQK